MKRRDFLESGIAAGAGLLLQTRARSADESGSAAQSLNVAIIGLGLQGRVLLNAAVKIPNLRFTAVCDIWPYSRRLATYLLKRYGHEPHEYEDFHELLRQEKGLDAVLIATPDHCHAEQAIAAMQAGVHVYCERPMAHSLEAAAAMVKAARESGRLLQIGYQQRSNPRYLHVRQRLLGEAKLFGRIFRAHCQWYQPIRDDLGWPARFVLAGEVLHRYGYRDMHQFRNWRDFQALGGGTFASLLSPHADAVGWLLDARPKTVIAIGGRDYYASRESYDNITALVEYDTPAGPLRAEYRVLTLSSGDGIRSCQHLLGCDGSIRMSENPRWTAIYKEAHAADWEPWVERGFLIKTKETEPSGPVTSMEQHVRETGVIVPFGLPVILDAPLHQPHLENFFAAARGESELRCPAPAAFVTEALIHKVNEALAQGTRLEIDSAAFDG